jgi:hypothetical protein
MSTDIGSSSAFKRAKDNITPEHYKLLKTIRDRAIEIEIESRIAEATAGTTKGKVLTATGGTNGDNGQSTTVYGGTEDELWRKVLSGELPTNPDNLPAYNDFLKKLNETKDIRSNGFNMQNIMSVGILMLLISLIKGMFSRG